MVASCKNRFNVYCWFHMSSSGLLVSNEWLFYIPPPIFSGHKMKKPGSASKDSLAIKSQKPDSPGLVRGPSPGLIKTSSQSPELRGSSPTLNRIDSPKKVPSRVATPKVKSATAIRTEQGNYTSHSLTLAIVSYIGIYFLCGERNAIIYWCFEWWNVWWMWNKMWDAIFVYSFVLYKP